MTHVAGHTNGHASGNGHANGAGASGALLHAPKKARKHESTKARKAKRNGNGNGNGESHAPTIELPGGWVISASELRQIYGNAYTDPESEHLIVKTETGFRIDPRGFPIAVGYCEPEQCEPGTAAETAKVDVIWSNDRARGQRTFSIADIDSGIYLSRFGSPPISTRSERAHFADLLKSGIRFLPPSVNRITPSLSGWSRSPAGIPRFVLPDLASWYVDEAGGVRLDGPAAAPAAPSLDDLSYLTRAWADWSPDGRGVAVLGYVLRSLFSSLKPVGSSIVLTGATGSSKTTPARFALGITGTVRDDAPLTTTFTASAAAMKAKLTWRTDLPSVVDDFHRLANEGSLSRALDALDAMLRAVADGDEWAARATRSGQLRAPAYLRGGLIVTSEEIEGLLASAERRMAWIGYADDIDSTGIYDQWEELQRIWAAVGHAAIRWGVSIYAQPGGAAKLADHLGRLDREAAAAIEAKLCELRPDAPHKFVRSIARNWGPMLTGAKLADDAIGAVEGDGPLIETLRQTIVGLALCQLDRLAGRSSGMTATHVHAAIRWALSSGRAYLNSRKKNGALDQANTPFIADYGYVPRDIFGDGLSMWERRGGTLLGWLDDDGSTLLLRPAQLHSVLCDYARRESKLDFAVPAITVLAKALAGSGIAVPDTTPGYRHHRPTQRRHIPEGAPETSVIVLLMPDESACAACAACAATENIEISINWPALSCARPAHAVFDRAQGVRSGDSEKHEQFQYVDSVSGSPAHAAHAAHAISQPHARAHVRERAPTSFHEVEVGQVANGAEHSTISTPRSGVQPAHSDQFAITDRPNLLAPPVDTPQADPASTAPPWPGNAPDGAPWPGERRSDSEGPSLIVLAPQFRTRLREARGPSCPIPRSRNAAPGPASPALPLRESRQTAAPENARPAAPAIPAEPGRVEPPSFAVLTAEAGGLEPTSLEELLNWCDDRRLEQAFLLPSWCHAAGLPAKWRDAKLGDTRHLTHEGLPHPWATVPAESRWQLSQPGKLHWSIWARHKSGQRSRSIEIVLPGYDDRSRLSDVVDAGIFAAALAEFRDATASDARRGFVYRGGPAETFMRIWRALAEDRRAGDITIDLAPADFPAPARRLDGKPGDQRHVAGNLYWHRQPLPAELSSTIAIVLDKNGMFPGAMAGLNCGIGRLRHVANSSSFDRSTVGWHHVRYQAPHWPGALPPPGLLLRPGAHGWLATETVDYLTAIGASVEISEGWLWTKNVRGLDRLQHKLRDARSRLMRRRDDRALPPARQEGAAIALDLLKQCIVRGIGWFARNDDQDKTEIVSRYRPHWRDAIMARAGANLLRDAATAAERSGHYPVAVYVDALLYLTSEPDPKAFVRKLGLKLGTAFGQYKISAVIPGAEVLAVLSGDDRHAQRKLNKLIDDGKRA